jgi:hypothetical protein
MVYRSSLCPRNKLLLNFTKSRNPLVGAKILAVHVLRAHAVERIYPGVLA